MCSARKIDFAIVGAQKSSTTFLHHALMCSPEIWMPRGEIPLFQGHHFAPHKVDRLVAQAGDARLIGIKRPMYLYDCGAGYRLSRHNPDMKIIIVLRDRVSRSLSAYYHLMRYGRLPVRAPEEGLPAIIEARDTLIAPDGYTVLTYSLYAFGTRIYRSLFGADNVLLIAQQELKSPGREGIRRVADFLGIAPPEIAEMADKSYQNAYYDLPTISLLAKAARLESYCNSAGIVMHGRHPPSWWQAKLAARLRSHAFRHSPDAPPPVLSEGLRARLEDYFADDLREAKAAGLPL